MYYGMMVKKTNIKKEKENTIMNENATNNEMNLETKKAANTVELKQMISANGCKMDVIYVDGQPFVNIGYVSETDKQACLKAVQTAVDNSDSLYEAAQKLTQIAALGHEGIDPDEQVNLETEDGEVYELMIAYKDRKAYVGTTEVANLDDLNLPSVGKDVIKTLLMDRAKFNLRD